MEAASLIVYKHAIQEQKIFDNACLMIARDTFCCPGRPLAGSSAFDGCAKPACYRPPPQPQRQRSEGRLFIEGEDVEGSGWAVQCVLRPLWMMSLCCVLPICNAIDVYRSPQPGCTKETTSIKRLCCVCKRVEAAPKCLALPAGVFEVLELASLSYDVGLLLGLHRMKCDWPTFCDLKDFDLEFFGLNAHNRHSLLAAREKYINRLKPPPPSPPPQDMIDDTLAQFIADNPIDMHAAFPILQTKPRVQPIPTYSSLPLITRPSTSSSSDSVISLLAGSPQDALRPPSRRQSLSARKEYVDDQPRVVETAFLHESSF